MYKKIINWLKKWKNSEHRKPLILAVTRQIGRIHENLHGLRFSMSNYREQGWMTNIPLYAVPTLFGE